MKHCNYLSILRKNVEQIVVSRQYKDLLSESVNVATGLQLASYENRSMGIFYF